MKVAPVGGIPDGAVQHGKLSLSVHPTVQFGTHNRGEICGQQVWLACKIAHVLGAVWAMQCPTWGMGRGWGMGMRGILRIFNTMLWCWVALSNVLGPEPLTGGSWAD